MMSAAPQRLGVQSRTAQGRCSNAHIFALLNFQNPLLDRVFNHELDHTYISRLLKCWDGQGIKQLTVQSPAPCDVLWKNIRKRDFELQVLGVTYQQLDVLHWCSTLKNFKALVCLEVHKSRNIHHGSIRYTWFALVRLIPAFPALREITITFGPPSCWNSCMTLARCCCDMDPTNLHVMKPALERWASMTVRNWVNEENTIAFCAGSEALICSSSGKQVKKRGDRISKKFKWMFFYLVIKQIFLQEFWAL